MMTITKIEAAIEETKNLVEAYPASTGAGEKIRVFLAYLKFLRESNVLWWTSPLVNPSIEALLVSLAQEQEKLLHVLFRIRN